jgi:hypothetical protein
MFVTFYTVIATGGYEVAASGCWTGPAPRSVPGDLANVTKGFKCVRTEIGTI